MGINRLLLVAGVTAGLLAGSGTAGAASAVKHFGHGTCRSGALKTGVYASLRITGVCTLPAHGRVLVRHDLVVAPHAALNAVTSGRLDVHGNVLVRRGAIAGLGCTAEEGCKTPTNNHIGGTLRARHAAAVIVEQEHVRGNVSLVGGGGSMDCGSTGLFGGPFFFALEDSTVRGNVVVRRVHSCWFGMIRDRVGGDVRIQGNRMGDPDAMEIVTNRIRGNLGCFNNRPQAQVGDSEGQPNVVGGRARGECKSL